MQYPDAEHRTSTASQYTQLHEKLTQCTIQKQKASLPMFSLTKIWRILHGRAGIRILSLSAESISHEFIL